MILYGQITYDMTSAKTICNDAVKNTWEVVAMTNRGWYTVSDSSQMSEQEAESLAASMAQSAAHDIDHDDYKE